MTTDITTARIRWEPNGHGTGVVGYVGTMSEWLFQIWSPDAPGGEWVLQMAHTQGGDYRPRYGASPDELKPEAETIFARFVASLGAVFPEG